MEDPGGTAALPLQSCPPLCDPMDRSTPGLPVHHQLPEFTQSQVHRVGDATQPSHPLSSPSPRTLANSPFPGSAPWGLKVEGKVCVCVCVCVCSGTVSSSSPTGRVQEGGRHRSVEGGFLPAWRTAQNPPGVPSAAAPAVRAPPHQPLCKGALVEPKAPHPSSTTAFSTS